MAHYVHQIMIAASVRAALQMSVLLSYQAWARLQSLSLANMWTPLRTGFGASIEANFIVGSQVRQHKATHACPQAYFGMILARISGDPDFEQNQAMGCRRSWKTRRRKLSLRLAMVIRPAALVGSPAPDSGRAFTRPGPLFLFFPHPFITQIVHRCQNKHVEHRDRIIGWADRPWREPHNRQGLASHDSSAALLGAIASTSRFPLAIDSANQADSEIGPRDRVRYLGRIG